MLISIITICFNCKEELVRTIDSVKIVKNSSIEYVVVDGGSTDGTLNVLSSSSVIDRFVSEPDSGIYDAMNKGADLSNGQYLLYLNAGDVFSEDFSLGRVVDELSDSSPDILVGNAYIEKSNRISVFKRRRLDYIKFGMAFCHQAAFTKASIFEAKKFNESYRIASDFEFYYDLYHSQSSILYIDDFVALVDGHGVSNTEKYKSTKERYRVVESNGGMTPVLRVRFLYHFVRSIFSDVYSRYFRLV